MNGTIKVLKEKYEDYLNLRMAMPSDYVKISMRAHTHAHTHNLKMLMT